MQLIQTTGRRFSGIGSEGLKVRHDVAGQGEVAGGDRWGGFGNGDVELENMKELSMAD